MLNSTDAAFQVENDLQTNLSAPSGGTQSQSVDPDNPSWGVGAALFVWIASVALIIVMPVLFLVPYAASRGLRTNSPDYVKAIAELALNDKTAVLLQVIAILPTHLLTFALIWALVTRFGKQKFWPAIGFSSSGHLEVVFWSVIGVVLFGVGLLLAVLFGSGKPTQFEQIINSSLAARYAISVLAVGTAPFVEEFMYRGVLYAPLQKLAGAPVAVCLVLGLFTIIHVPQYWPNFGAIAAVAVLSVALTFVRAYTHRLLPCIIIHLVFNGIQAVILLVEPYAQRVVPSPEPVAPTCILFSLAHLIR